MAPVPGSGKSKESVIFTGSSFLQEETNTLPEMKNNPSKTGIRVFEKEFMAY
jgi:hypothetical protein